MEKLFKIQNARRFLVIAIGIGAIWLGIHFYNHQWSYLYSFSVAKGTGIIIAIIGVTISLYGIFKKNIPKGFDDNFVICVSCLASFYSKDISNGICPKCNGTVENIDGFYVRHPELKT